MQTATALAADHGAAQGIFDQPDKIGSLLWVDAELFRIVSAFASSDPKLPALAGVCVQRHETGVVLVASDNRQLLCVHDPDGWSAFDRDVLANLPASALKHCRPRGTARTMLGIDDRGRDFAPTFSAGSAMASIAVATGGLTAEYLADSPCNLNLQVIFPAWRRMLPVGRLTAAPPHLFESWRLARFADAAAALTAWDARQNGRRPSKMGGSIVVLASESATAARSAGEHLPAVAVRFGGCETALGLMVPPNAPPDSLALPAFLSSPAPARI